MEIITAIREHATSLELFQAALATFGFFLTVWIMIDTLKDSYALILQGIVGPRRVIAFMYIWNAFERLLAQVCLMALGHASILLPPPPFTADTEGEALQLAITRVVIIVLNFILVCGSLRERYQRRVYIRLLRASALWDGIGHPPGPAALAPPPGPAPYPSLPPDDPRQMRKDAGVWQDPPKRAGE